MPDDARLASHQNISSNKVNIGMLLSFAYLPAMEGVAKMWCLLLYTNSKIWHIYELKPRQNSLIFLAIIHTHIT